MNSQFFGYSGKNMEKSVALTGELLAKQVEIVSTLLPLPSMQSLNDLEKAMNEPRRIANKPIHVLSILLTMLLCISMFSAQLWDIASTDCKEEHCSHFQDPEDMFASKYYHPRIFCYNTSDRKIVVLVSTSITFLLCTSLLLLMRGTTVLRWVPWNVLSRLQSLLLLFQDHSLWSHSFWSGNLFLSFLNRHYPVHYLAWYQGVQSLLYPQYGHPDASPTPGSHFHGSCIQQCLPVGRGKGREQNKQIPHLPPHLGQCVHITILGHYDLL